MGLPPPPPPGPDPIEILSASLVKAPTKSVDSSVWATAELAANTLRRQEAGELVEARAAGAKSRTLRELIATVEVVDPPTSSWWPFW